MKRASAGLKRGGKAVLLKVPPGFIDDLPAEDQRALSKIVGKPVRFSGYDELGQAELEWRERNGTFHTIWVKPEFVQLATNAAKRRSRRRGK
jgi:hypothetical protein